MSVIEIVFTERGATRAEAHRLAIKRLARECATHGKMPSKHQIAVVQYPDGWRARATATWS